MKALVYTATEQIRYQDAEPPHPQADDALVDIQAVGICGSDMHAYRGHDPRRVPPLILGHEAVGRVISGRYAGRRMLLNPLITCGKCAHCRGGRSNLCLHRELIGMRLPGAFAEQVAIAETNLIPVPEDMDPVHAALTEPAATGVHAVSLAARALPESIHDCRALVMGAGSVGLLAALYLQDQGCESIRIAETNPLRRNCAAAAGAFACFDPPTQPATLGGHELVIDAVGSGLTRAAACRAVCPGGVIMHIGLLDNEPGIDARRLTLQEITLIGTYTYTQEDFVTSIEKLHVGALGDLAWVERRPLSDGVRAFDDLLHGRCAAPKIVLCP